MGGQAGFGLPSIFTVQAQGGVAFGEGFGVDGSGGVGRFVLLGSGSGGGSAGGNYLGAPLVTLGIL